MTANTTEREVRRTIQRGLDENRVLLPSSPKLLTELRQAIHSESIGAKELAAMILDDPPLAAKVLRFANSAFYRRSRKKVRTITGAVVRLGHGAVSNLALALCIYRLLKRLPTGERDDPIWKHSLCTAVCAQHLAVRMGHPIPEEAFLAGLLHDAGKVLLAEFFPGQYAEVVKLVSRGEVSWVSAERALMKYDHALAFGDLAEYWNFAQDLRQAGELHEQYGEIDLSTLADAPLTRIVLVANRMIHYMYREDPDEDRISLRQLTQLCDTWLEIDDTGVYGVMHDIEEGVDRISPIFEISQERTPREVPPEDVAAREGSAKIALLLRCNEATLHCDRVAHLLRQTGADLLSALKLRDFVLLFMNAQSERLEAKFGMGPGIHEMESRMVIAVDRADDVAASAYIKGAAVIVDQSNLHRFSRLRGANMVTLLSTANLAAIPVTIEFRVIAVLVVSRDNEADPISAEDIRILTAYARDLGAVIGRQRDALLAERATRRKGRRR